jgi:transcriptional regulator with XRE-family HTH domain
MEVLGFDPLVSELSQVIDNNSMQGINFADYLKKILRERNLSQRGLALQAGIDHSTLSRLMSKDMDSSLVIFAAITGFLSLSDQVVYEIVLGSLPEREVASKGRTVFKKTAPVSLGNFGEQLKGYRKRRGIPSQKALAAKVREFHPNRAIDHSEIYRIEARGRKPMFSTFAGIAYALGLNPAQVGGLVKAA